MGRDIETQIAAFAKQMQDHWGVSLSAIVLYGSAVRDDFVPGRSDLNFLVLGTDLPPHKLMDLQSLSKTWAKQRIATPIFMQLASVERALDSYPLEFLSMKAAYRVVSGVDVIKTLTFDRESIRLQCERELRGNLLHLRAGLVDCGRRRGRMQDLVRSSLPAFTAVLQGLLFVVNKPHALWGHDLIEAAGTVLGVEAALFHRLAKVRVEKKAPPRDELVELLSEYVRAIERLMAWADAHEIGPAPAPGQ